MFNSIVIPESVSSSVNGWEKVWTNNGDGNIDGVGVDDDMKIYPGDFDGDGDEELLCVNQTWMTVLYYENGDWNWGWSNYGNDHAMVPYRDYFIVGDYDGDGKDELLGNGPGWITMFHFENNDWNWGWSDYGESTDFGAYRNNFNVGDYDGDGKDEILGFASWSTMFHFENGDWQWGWSDYGSQHAIWAYRNNVKSGDFDGDGKDEILGFDSWSTLFHYGNNDWQWGWSTYGSNNFEGWDYPLFPTDRVLVGNISTCDIKDELMFIQTGNNAEWAALLDLNPNQNGWSWTWAANPVNGPYIDDWPLANQGGSNAAYLLVKAEKDQPKYLMTFRKYLFDGNAYNYIVNMYKSTAPTGCCPELSTAPTDLYIVEDSDCNQGCISSYGAWGLTSPSSCPEGYSLKRFNSATATTGGTAFTSTPVYDQVNPQTFHLRCVCDADDGRYSPVHTVTSSPDLCSEPVFDPVSYLYVAEESSCDASCTLTNGAWALTSGACPNGYSLRSFSNATTTTGGTLLTNAPSYNSANPQTFHVRCVCNADSGMFGPVQTVTSSPGSCPFPSNAPTDLYIVEDSDCNQGCISSYGAWGLSSPSSCPEGYNLKSFSSPTATTGGTAFTSTPVYDQVNPQTFHLRCVCDGNDSRYSPVHTITSSPNLCTEPVFDPVPYLYVASESSCDENCVLTNGSWALTSGACPSGYSLRSFISATTTTGGTLLTNAPSYDSTNPQTFHVRCVCNADSGMFGPVQTVTSLPDPCSLPSGSGSITGCDFLCVGNEVLTYNYEIPVYENASNYRWTIKDDSGNTYANYTVVGCDDCNLITLKFDDPVYLGAPEDVTIEVIPENECGNATELPQSLVISFDKECVWPGDVDNDDVVNVSDWLKYTSVLSCYNGSNLPLPSGPMRINCDATVSTHVWQPQPAESWNVDVANCNSVPNGWPDFKHFDCDGDGELNPNMGSSYPGGVPAEDRHVIEYILQTKGPSFVEHNENNFRMMDAISIHSDKTNIDQVDNDVELTFSMGDNESVENVTGIAFDLRLTTGVFTNSSFQYLSNNFEPYHLGYPTIDAVVMDFVYTAPNNNIAILGLSRVDNIGKAFNGELFVRLNTSISELPENGILSVIVNNAYLAFEDGEIVPVGVAPVEISIGDGTPCPPAGIACNDGDINTIGDATDGYCNCKGDIIGSCPTSRTLTGSVYNDQQVKTAEFVISSAQITPGTNVEYKAGLYHLFQAGFHVEGGAEFLAGLEPCETTTAPRLNNPVALEKAYSLNLSQNINNSEVLINLKFPEKNPIEIELLDLNGTLVSNIDIPENLNDNNLSLSFSASTLTAGVYLVKVSFEDRFLQEKLVLVQDKN